MKDELLKAREDRPLTPALREAQDSSNAALSTANAAMVNLSKARSALIKVVEAENLRKLREK